LFTIDVEARSSDTLTLGFDTIGSPFAQVFAAARDDGIDDGIDGGRDGERED
jgi:hypothetical protein